MDEHPKLRYVDAFPVEVEGQKLIYLRDPEGLTDQTLAVPYPVFYLLTLCDGEHLVTDLQEAFQRKFNGSPITGEQIGQLIGQLDEAYLMEGERFQVFRQEVEARFRAALGRPAAHAGVSYPDDPEALRGMTDGFFEPPEGARGSKRGEQECTASRSDCAAYRFQAEGALFCLGLSGPGGGSSTRSVRGFRYRPFRALSLCVEP